MIGYLPTAVRRNQYIGTQERAKNIVIVCFCKAIELEDTTDESYKLCVIFRLKLHRGYIDLVERDALDFFRSQRTLRLVSYFNCMFLQSNSALGYN